jgi:hypothetical protein
MHASAADESEDGDSLNVSHTLADDTAEDVDHDEDVDQGNLQKAGKQTFIAEIAQDATEDGNLQKAGKQTAADLAGTRATEDEHLQKAVKAEDEDG